MGGWTIRSYAWLLFCSSIIEAQTGVLTRRELSEGWLMLFDGGSLLGWNTADAAEWRVNQGTILAGGKGVTYLRSNAEFSDFVLRAQVRASGGSSLLVRVPRGKPTDAGSEIPFGGASSGGAPGWQPLEVEVRGEQIRASLNGEPLPALTGRRSKAGALAFRGSAGGKLEVRDVRLKPLELDLLYNGSNMDGWKLVTPPPPVKQGRKILNVIPLPTGKTPAAQWTIRDGAIHADQGKGQLETTQHFEDFLLQFEVSSGNKGNQRTSLFVRGETGKIETGYEIALNTQSNAGAGSIIPLHMAIPAKLRPEELLQGTLIANGRHLLVWINGRLVTDYEDRRPAGANIEREARLAGGPVALAVEEGASADFRSLRIQRLQSGAQPEPANRSTANDATSATPSAVPVTPAVAVSPAAAPAASDNALAQSLAQQQTSTQQEEQKRQQVSQLMQQGLRSDNPQEQIRTYGQILAIDPNNQVAYNARKEAEGKITQSRDEETRKQAQTQSAAEEAATREERRRRALEAAERALLRGDLSTSEGEARIAEKLAPQDPNTRRLLNVIDSRLQLRTRLMYLVFGTTSLGVVAIALALLRRRRNREPALEIVQGQNKGRHFELKEEVTRIGAVNKSDGDANDIVLDDYERSISRFHCEVHRSNGKLYLIDCGSSNGTYLDGRRLPSERATPIGRGAKIRLGKTCTLQLGYRARK